MFTRSFATLSIAFVCASAVHAGTLIVPNSNPAYPTGTSLDGPFSDGEMSRVTLINANQLLAMVGKTITGVAFKSHTLNTTTWPSSPANYIACDLYLGPCVLPGAKSLTLLSNYTRTRTQVRSGSISFPANFVPTGNQFHAPIAITPYVYTGGNLLFEHRRRGFYGTSRDLTSVRQSDPAYNNLISAVRTGTYAGLTGSQHNAPVIQFSYEEPAMLISGEVTLQSFIGAYPSVPVQIQVFPAGSSTAVYSQMIALGTSGAYSISLPSALTPGNYDLALNGSPFLRSVLLNQSLSAGGNTADFSLRNGDVDDSTEVDAADIDAVIASFGSIGGTGDVDGSEEVDAADIDIVIANFGATDE